jgi:HK97 family phage major capsid protein
MNLAKIIAKFVKLGLSGLTDDENALLKQNVSLLSPVQRDRYQKEVAAEPEGDEDDETDEDEEDEKKEDEDEESLDEKGLKEMISKSVSDEISSKVNSMADQLVAKFVKGAKSQRQRALNGGTKTVDPLHNETRNFLKALVGKDYATLKTIQQGIREKATFNSTDDSDARGGYLVPDELRAEVLRIAETMYGVARREFLYLPFTGPGNSRKIPTLASSVTVFWTDESAVKGGTNPTFGIVTQTLKKLAAIVPLTEELIEDSAVNITQLVAQLFAEAVAKEEDTQFFMGTGSPWTGLLNNGSINIVNLGAGEGFADVTADDLLDMIDETPAGALAGAKFYLHRHMLSVIRKLKDVTSGQYIYQRPGEGLPGTIWDYPYVLVEAFPTNTTTGLNKPLLGFGNLKLAAVFGDKQQIRVKLLDQATITDGDGSTVINLAEQDMIALRMEERVGYVVAIPTAFTVLKTGTTT